MNGNLSPAHEAAIRAIGENEDECERLRRAFVFGAQWQEQQPIVLTPVQVEAASRLLEARRVATARRIRVAPEPGAKA